jgi:ABC-2 type transport system ATP-binding protein
MEYAIETRELSRAFGKTEAVRRLTLQVPTGSLFAFVGPNGAGKTTTIKVLMGLLEPSAGSATVCGRDSRALGPRDFRRIGYVSENQDLPQWMTLEDLVGYCRPFYPTWDQAFAADLASQLDVPTGKTIKSMSRGMRMKAALLVALAYHPELLIMDEPFAGLDPLVREELGAGVLELTQQKAWTVFVSSHDIDEVERMADWIGILNKGRLELAEPVSSLLGRFRQVDVAIDPIAGVPSGLPSSWLLPAAEGRVVRFVESQFTEAGFGERVRAVLPTARDVNAQPMSLRSIFVALARVFRISEFGGEAT